MINYRFRKLKLVYSYGLTRSCDHYLDDIEHFTDIKTLNEFDTQPCNYTKVIVGEPTYGGDYLQSKISIYELHDKYLKFLKLCKDEDIVIEALFREYNFIPLIVNPKYQNRYYSPDYI